MESGNVLFRRGGNGRLRLCGRYVYAARLNESGKKSGKQRSSPSPCCICLALCFNRNAANVAMVCCIVSHYCTRPTFAFVRICSHVSTTTQRTWFSCHAGLVAGLAFLCTVVPSPYLHLFANQRSVWSLQLFPMPVRQCLEHVPASYCGQRRVAAG